MTAGLEQQPFVDELRKHAVEAKVMQYDSYRVHGVMAVRTDFIIMVQQKNNSSSDNNKSFEPFLISKRYHAFRKFADELVEASTTFQKKMDVRKKMAASSHRTVVAISNDATLPAMELMKYCESIDNLIDSQPKQYLQKVDIAFVKKEAIQRSQILNSVLKTTIEQFPVPEVATAKTTTAAAADEIAFQQKVAQVIETFFLTDVCSLEATSYYLHNNNNANTNQTSEGAEDNKHSGEKNPFRQFLSPITSNLNKLCQQPQQQNLAEADTKPKTGSRIVPLTMRERRSEDTRLHDERELEKASASDQGLIMEPEITSTRAVPVVAAPVPAAAAAAAPPPPPPAPVVYASAFENLNNPWLWASSLLMAVALLARAGHIRVQLKADLELLLLFSAFCIGLHTPRIARSTTTGRTAKSKGGNAVSDPAGRRLMRRSMLMKKPKTTRLLKELKPSTSGKGSDTPDLQEDKEVEAMLMEEEEDEEEETGTPMTEFPVGAELGSVTNCWGKSHADDFKVRGPNYLKDKKKVPSQDFILPVRGVELLLTDTCPANVGRNMKLLRGTLRDVPTFILNFRLPWGILLCYFEIPLKFIPYLQLCYEPEAIDETTKAKLEAAMQDMGPGERCACRYFMKPTEHKNKNLKIVPVVVKGPWVVRSVVDGKPGIIGTKLPIDYIYQKDEGKGKALYWEADLDICASSAARGILSVVRSYTQILTLDLGFVVQGNTDDELPEQMLVGVRLHGVDPMNAPAYPEIHEDHPLHAAAGATETSSEE